MRRSYLFLLLGCALALPTLAHAGLSLSTTAASDYIADGISATDSHPALQLGLD